MPTRGSPALSSWTSGRLASQSISLEASATSPLGSFSPILPVGPAEAARRPGQHRVPVAGEVLGLGAHVLLAAAEAVREQDGGPASGGVAGEVRRVDSHPVARTDQLVGAVDRGCPVGGDGAPGAGAGEHHDGGPGGDPPSGPPQCGQSKIHASTLRAGDLSAPDSFQAEPRPLPREYGTSRPGTRRRGIRRQLPGELPRSGDAARQWLRRVSGCAGTRGPRRPGPPPGPASGS